MSAAAGTRLGYYEIVGQIGAGGATSITPATPGWIARSRSRLSAPISASARFTTSANEHDGTAYLVMEYVDGRPLTGPLPIADVLRYGAEIARPSRPLTGRASSIAT